MSEITHLGVAPDGRIAAYAGKPEWDEERKMHMPLTGECTGAVAVSRLNITLSEEAARDSLCEVEPWFAEVFRPEWMNDNDE